MIRALTLDDICRNISKAEAFHVERGLPGKFCRYSFLYNWEHYQKLKIAEALGRISNGEIVEAIGYMTVPCLFTADRRGMVAWWFTSGRASGLAAGYLIVAAIRRMERLGAVDVSIAGKAGGRITERLMGGLGFRANETIYTKQLWQNP